MGAASDYGVDLCKPFTGGMRLHPRRAIGTGISKFRAVAGGIQDGCEVMIRAFGLFAAVLGLIGAALVGLSGMSSAATIVNAVATGRVTVTITAPSGVPADVRLTGPRKAVFAKPPQGERKTTRRRLPVGSYRVRPLPVVLGGVLYQSANHQVITVRAGQPAKVTVRFTRARSASSLHVTGITATSISLAWSAPAGAVFALRRTAGGRPASSRQSGTAVAVKGHTATDKGLRPGKQYSYALFTRMKGSWAGPITLLTGTSAPAGSKTASYAATPGTVLATPAAVQSDAPTGSGAQVTLSPSVTTPVIGSAVVLPPSPRLPGGYVGKVTAISTTGSTVTLQPASLSDAFSYYSVNVQSFTTSATPLKLIAAHVTSHGRRRAASADCGGSSSGTITFNPSLRLDGSFHATINTTSYLHIPKGASLSMKLTATMTGAMSVATSAGLSCSLSFGPFLHVFAADPVPIAVYFSPSAEVSIESAEEESNLGAKVTGGVQFAGSLGVRSGAHFSGSDILTAQPLTPEISQGGSVKLKVGGQFIVGPGAGDKHAGAIAGVSAEFDPLDASFSPQDGNNGCFKTSAAMTFQGAITAKAWLNGWSIDRNITFPALNGKWPYHGSPWFSPSGCQNATPLKVNGGALPDAQVSTQYDHTLSASGGTQPYTWAIINGSVPSGLSLASNGEITGTPVSQGTSQFTAQVTDNDGKTATGTFSLTVNPAVTSPDAITEYDVSPDLDCAMFASGDADGEFYGGHACGTIVALGGQLYGPSDIPAGSNLTDAPNYVAWTPATQSTSGSGTSADPFVITTSASADGTPINVTQTDTYAVGGSTVSTQTTLTNTSGSPVQLMLYHGFDCFPGDSDTGTGTASGGSVSCVSDNVTSSGARTVHLSPASTGSTYVEERFADMWSDIATGNPFPNTVRADDHDTAEGLAWPVTVPANASVSIQYATDLLLTQQ